MTTRRQTLIALPLLLPAWTGAQPVSAHGALHDAMQRARALRDEAVRAGDQPYGAAVLRGAQIADEARIARMVHGDALTDAGLPT